MALVDVFILVYIVLCFPALYTRTSLPIPALVTYGFNCYSGRDTCADKQI